MKMKRNKKIWTWVIAAVVLVLVVIIGNVLYKKVLYKVFNPPFEETVVFPAEGGASLADTTFTVNGIQIKMKGIKGGKINCRGLRETVELEDFYIGETEVTQELWTSIMGKNPSVHKDSVLCPVENVDLVECLDFIHKLDSISGHEFYLPTYPEWAYVAYVGSKGKKTSYYDESKSWYKENADSTSHPVKQKAPNALGIYDMVGNVAEWTISGSDPMFFVMGGSYQTERKGFDMDEHELFHANIKDGFLGLRLVCYPKGAKQ